MSNKRNSIILGICFAFSNNVSAASLNCAGSIDLVTIHQPGFVGVKLSSMNDQVFICRLDMDYNPPGAAMITPAVCKAIYAGLLTAKVNQYTINSLWFDGDKVPSTCNGWTGGSQVNLRFLPLG